MESTSPKIEKLRPLMDFVDHTDQLAEQTLESVDWKQVEKMMPRILKGKSRDDIKQLLLAELDGMSKKRIIAVLSGHDFEESSKKEEEDVTQASESDISEDGEIKSDDGKKEEKQKEVEEKSDETENVEKGEEIEEEDEEERVNREIQEEVDSFFD
ncbi:unnamed protein product [Caenorhabditis angaria]|uniref:Uncharacterized protein n=1 Tax=Caenorhabditis angaria TaxID=860376 RepID=A0A9P1IB27_9PELO|nr:unnamed protein product [Caenorhabditis angaria]